MSSSRLPAGVRPYLEPAPLAALFLGISSGFAFAMIGATLTTRLAQHGVTKSAVTAFALTFLAYNFKFLWAPIVDNVRLPLIGRFGQRRSWLWLVGVLVMAAVAFLGLADPDELALPGRDRRDHARRGRRHLRHHHRRLSHRAARAAPARRRLRHVAVRLAARLGGGRRARAGARGSHRLDRRLYRLRRVRAAGDAGRRGDGRARRGTASPPGRTAWSRRSSPTSARCSSSCKRQGALVVLLFVLIHKIGDTLANLTLRLLFKDLGFSNDEVAFYDIGVGFVALLIGIFVGGILYARLGMKRSVLISLILMAVSNFSFAALAAAGHTNIGMAAAVGFENFASGIGGVTVVAYLSALCNLRFTATQYALLSALASIAGRFLTGTTAGALITAIGYVNFYLLTTLIAFPGVILFWFMMRSGLADVSIGSAGKDGRRLTERLLVSTAPISGLTTLA